MAFEDPRDEDDKEQHHHCFSQPQYQFQAQKLREKDRLVYQIKQWSQGRPQTFPFDPRETYEMNAINNVRKCWINQGIWNYSWEIYHPHVYWNHDLPLRLWNAFILKVESPPAPAAEQEPDANKRLLASDSKVPQPLSPTDSSASRPYHQFIYQVSREELWIRDQLKFEQLPGCVDVSAKAYESVKAFWIEQRIWDSNWTLLPGMEWLWCKACCEFKGKYQSQVYKNLLGISYLV